MEGKKQILEDARKDQSSGTDRPKYVPPRIVSYSSEEILEQVGPALTCSGAPCPPAS
jgi:hypothetical protein